MKRYVSLGSAMMMGFVSAQAKDTYDFQESSIAGMEKALGSEVPDLHIDARRPTESVVPLPLQQSSNEDPPIPIDGKNNGFYNGPDWGLMRPHRPKKPIQCGRRIKIVANWEFQCYDYVEREYYDCIGIATPV